MFLFSIFSRHRRFHLGFGGIGVLVVSDVKGLSSSTTSPPEKGRYCRYIEPIYSMRKAFFSLL